VKRLSPTWALLAAAIAVAGCTGPGETATTQTTTTTTTTAPTTTVLTTTTSITTTTAVPTTTTIPTTTMPTVEIPPGFALKGGSDVGFLVALPEGFVSLDLSSEDVDSLLADSPLSDDMLAATRAAIEAGTFRFWAFDFSDGDESFVPNVNVQVLPRTGLDNVDVYLEVLPQQYESLGAILMSLEQVEYEFGPAVTAVAQFPVGDGTSSTAFQLLAPVGDFVYTITISYLDPNDRQAEDAATALSTFQPLGG